MEVSIASFRGQVTVNLTVDSEQARQAVEKNLTQLERQLMSSGVKVDQFQVNVSQSAKSHAFAQNEHYFQGGFNGRQGRGYQQPTRSQKLMQQFAPSGPSFETVMVNCLA
jgi:flagellar hook-length control protein FliK